MGKLVDGTWHDIWYDTKSSGGSFVRSTSAFRDQVTADGSSRFPAEPGRYHLYVSNACPWANRTLIVRALKGLTEVISTSSVHPLMLDQGWTFTHGYACTGDPISDHDYLHQVYTQAKADYTGRVTVPILWDRQTQTIVNNESSEIIRIFNQAFNAWGNAQIDLYPEALRDEIDAINDRIYATVNNGVYQSGFASTQDAYETSVVALFETFDWLEERLATQRYLAGDQITEADWRLFVTLVRFDPVYHGHFKCNLHRLVDYPNLWAYTRELYQVPGVADTVHLDEVKVHYYASHRMLNPSGVVPKGPMLDLWESHGREGLIARG